MFGSCPIAGFNGDSSSGGGGNGGKFSTAVPSRQAANGVLSQFLAEPTRAYLLIVNESVTDLFVSLDLNVDPTAGAEHASIVLPGGVSAGYDLSGYTGPFSLQYPNGDDSAEGYCLVTRGYDP
jgi:hypothetical protein